jgi:predicted nucleic acid-binding Zn ribbon protein
MQCVASDGGECGRTPYPRHAGHRLGHWRQRNYSKLPTQRPSEWRGTSRSIPLCHRACRDTPNRRGSDRMSALDLTFRIVRHVVKRGERYGKLAVIREVQKAGEDGRRYRAALCRCDCGKQVIPRISSLKAGDAQSCGCSRGQSRYEQKHCPVCGALATIRRDHKSCSRACGHELARAARQAANPSYEIWHKRVKRARGPASG